MLLLPHCNLFMRDAYFLHFAFHFFHYLGYFLFIFMMFFISAFIFLCNFISPLIILIYIFNSFSNPKSFFFCPFLMTFSSYFHTFFLIHSLFSTSFYLLGLSLFLKSLPYKISFDFRRFPFLSFFFSFSPFLRCYQFCGVF